MAKEILVGFGVDVDAVAGWLGSYGGEDSPDDISRGLFAGEVGSPRLVKLFDRLGIKTPSVSSEVGTLSGGNQQKVALARWLATRPAVLILDEPTQGVDVAAKAEIHQLIAELARGGLAILLISSELPEVLGMCDRIAVMHAGGVAGIVDRTDATQDEILHLALFLFAGADRKHGGGGDEGEAGKRIGIRQRAGERQNGERDRRRRDDEAAAAPAPIGQGR